MSTKFRPKTAGFVGLTVESVNLSMPSSHILAVTIFFGVKMIVLSESPSFLIKKENDSITVGCVNLLVTLNYSMQ